MTTGDRRTAFIAALTEAYTDLFKNDPEYAYSASRIAPEALAVKMTDCMIDNSANHGGAGMRRAAKAIGIKHTRKAIRAYLAGE